MGRTNHASVQIGKQYRLAIGREHGQRQTGCRGDQRIGAGFVGKRAIDSHGGRGMDLMHPDQMRAGHPHGIGDTPAVYLDDFALIGTAAAAIQPRKYTRRCPATAREKAVPHGTQTVGCQNLKRHGSNPGGGGCIGG